jgi:DhnA family fructose-bisphosphate aldolase class Ia
MSTLIIISKSRDSMRISQMWSSANKCHYLKMPQLIWERLNLKKMKKVIKNDVIRRVMWAAPGRMGGLL